MTPHSPKLTQEQLDELIRLGHIMDIIIVDEDGNETVAPPGTSIFDDDEEPTDATDDNRG